MIRNLQNSIFMVLAAVLFSGPIWAQNDSGVNVVPSTAANVGFVNGAEVLYGTEEGKVQISKIQEFVTEQQAQYESERVGLEKVREQLAAQQLTASAQTRSKMQRKIEQSELRLNRLQEDARMVIDQKRNELLEKISERMQAIISQFASQKGFDAIILIGESHLYVNPALNYTKDIIQRYNEEYSASSSIGPASQP